MRTIRPGAPEGPGRIDQYELVRKLGGGGFGVVYLAHDTASGLDVAIKTLHPLLKHSPEEMETLREKFALVSRLAHPNIATALVLHPVREIDITNESVRREMRLSPGDGVMVMRYAPGTTLSRWRRQFPDDVVPFPLALEVARQIASALDYAHSEKIVHRDVKPGNIMVETLAEEPRASGQAEDPSVAEDSESSSDASSPSRIRVRILDFGLAAEIRSSMSRVSTEQGDTSGTRPYMAPEQWLGRKQDGRTDQYALACVLYEMLAGAPPFAGVFETGDPIIMMAAVKGETPQTIEGLSESANAALLRALSKNPDERFPTCSAFVAAMGGLSETSEFEAVSDAPARPSAGPVSGEREADRESVLFSRKVALGRELSSLSPEDRTDADFALPISQADDAFAAAEEALKYSRLAAAERCLDRVAAALEEFAGLRRRRQEEELRAAEEAERLRLEREAEKRKRREAAAKEEAERRRAANRAVTWAWCGILAFFLAVAIIGALMENGSSPVPVLNDSRSVSSSSPVSVAPRPSNPKAGDVRIVRVGDLEVRMHWCPPGSFDMGSPFGETGRKANENRHAVTLTKGFWISETVVTETLWASVMGHGALGLTPCNASWHDAHEFLDRLNGSARGAGVDFRLPTEAQWEYACRAGGKGPWPRLRDGRAGTVDLLAWHSSNSGKKPKEVRMRNPNAWGLHDMQGGVWEWCEDVYSHSLSGPVSDPEKPPAGAYDRSPRVIRGGSAWNPPRDCRAASRDDTDPYNRNATLGFRFVMLDK